MMYVLCPLAVVIFTYPLTTPVQAQPQVDTTHGTVEGFRQIVSNINVDTYYGIPFAVPPVGDLRFQKPVDVKAWNETLHVKKPHNTCFTYIDTMFDRRPGVEMWNPNTNMSEDCLYLNVWVPRGPTMAANKPMATMVWIFGGGFFSGTSTLEVYDGKYLASYADVIVVSINYRTGPLGFLYMGTDEVSGNMGLLDQQMALRWIFRNIENFGGDKSWITLFGESAGAASAGLHLYSEGSRDYFTQIIMQSAAASEYWTFVTRTEAESRAKLFALIYDCPVLDKAATIKCLKEISPARLSNDQFWVNGTGFLNTPFAPVVDGTFLIDDPASLTRKGRYKKTNTLLGVNKDEGTYWLLYGLTQYFNIVNNRSLSYSEFVDAVDHVLKHMNQDVRKAAISLYADSITPNIRNYRDILDDMLGDCSFKCSVKRFSEVASQHSNVYLYSFEERVNNLPWPQWMGVPHGYEIEIVFGRPLKPSLGYHSREVTFSKKVMTYWANFAKTGNPNGDTVPFWPQYNDNSRQYVILDISTTKYIQTGLRSVQCQFWNTIAPLLSKNDYDTMVPLTDRTTCINGVSRTKPVFIIYSILLIMFKLNL